MNIRSPLTSESFVWWCVIHIAISKSISPSVYAVGTVTYCVVATISLISCVLCGTCLWGALLYQYIGLFIVVSITPQKSTPGKTCTYIGRFFVYDKFSDTDTIIHGVQCSKILSPFLKQNPIFRFLKILKLQSALCVCLKSLIFE